MAHPGTRNRPLVVRMQAKLDERMRAIDKSFLQALYRGDTAVE